MATTTNGTVTIPIERYDELKKLYDSFHSGDVILRYSNQSIRVISKDEYVNEITKENANMKEDRERDIYYYRCVAIKELFRYDIITYFNAYFKIKKIKKLFDK